MIDKKDIAILPFDTQAEVLNPQLVGVVRTYTGGSINVLKPDSGDIFIEDIAHALSNMCRFGGHTTRFYSVAEHCIRCAEMVGPENALAALLHDASEAYLVDVPSPVKVAIPQYIEIEVELMRVIANKYGFEWPLHRQVKRADSAMLQLEWDNLMLTCNWVTMPAEYARARFLELFDTLTSK